MYETINNIGGTNYMLRPAYTSEYTLLSNTPTVAIGNELAKKVAVLGKFTGHSAGKYKITATAKDGIKTLCTALHFMTVTEKYDMYGKGTVTDLCDLTF